MFLPMLKVPTFGGLVTLNMVNYSSTGYLIVALLALLAALFYAGVPRVLVRLVGGISVAILCWEYATLIQELGDNEQAYFLGLPRRRSADYFSLLQWGMYVGVATTFFLTFISFLGKYRRNTIK